MINYFDYPFICRPCSGTLAHVPEHCEVRWTLTLHVMSFCRAVVDDVGDRALLQQSDEALMMFSSLYSSMIRKVTRYFRLWRFSLSSHLYFPSPPNSDDYVFSTHAPEKQAAFEVFF